MAAVTVMAMGEFTLGDAARRVQPPPGGAGTGAGPYAGMPGWGYGAPPPPEDEYKLTNARIAKAVADARKAFEEDLNDPQLLRGILDLLAFDKTLSAGPEPPIPAGTRKFLGLALIAAWVAPAMWKKLGRFLRKKARGPQPRPGGPQRPPAPGVENVGEPPEREGAPEPQPGAGGPRTCDECGGRMLPLGEEGGQFVYFCPQCKREERVR